MVRDFHSECQSPPLLVFEQIRLFSFCVKVHSFPIFGRSDCVWQLPPAACYHLPHAAALYETTISEPVLPPSPGWIRSRKKKRMRYVLQKHRDKVRRVWTLCSVVSAFLIT